jgi:Icc-related predicted phosphoesterase
MGILDFLFNRESDDDDAVIETVQKNKDARSYKKIMQPYQPRGLKILFIADTHGVLRDNVKQIIQDSDTEYNAVIFLGDHGTEEITQIKSYLTPDVPCYGITGNHDQKDLYTIPECSYVEDVGFKVFDIEGIKIAAFPGSIRYKNAPERCMYTQHEFTEAIKNMPAADIAIGHAGCYQESDLFERMQINEYGTNAHEGIAAITEYIERNKIPIYIHGHLHNPEEKILRNGTRDICLYGAQIIEV